MLSKSKIKSVLTKIFPLLILTAMLIEPMALVAQTPTSYPASTSITFISYNGDDANGILAFEHGQIAFYGYSLPISEYTSLPPGAKIYLFPATYYDILVNPLNTTFGFNPFQFQQVRFALNYIVNRHYFVDDVLHGYGIPGISVYAGEHCEYELLPVLSKYANVHYNFTYANETIYKVLTAHGAQYINGKWYYHGKPITVYVFDRVDTSVRKAYTGYLVSQLEKLGFTVQLIPGNLLKEQSVVYGSDPANSTWDILIEAWGGTYNGYFDCSLAEAFYSSIFGFSPFSSYYGLAFGTYNTTKYESPSFLKEADEVDNLTLILAQSEYTNEQQFYNILDKLVSLGINMSIRIGLGMSLSPIPVSANIQGVYPSFARSTALGFHTYLAIANGTYPNVTIGVRYLSQGAANPLAGYTDAYTADIANALFTPPYLFVPGTGQAVPYTFTYKVVNSSPEATIPVPSNAIWWNPEKQEITYVPTNTKAKVAVIYNFAPLINNDKFVDGQNITLADIIYEYIIAAEASLNSSNPIYESLVSADYSTYLQELVGFKIINSTAVEVWSDYWFFNPECDAIDILAEFPTLGTYGYMPWQMYVAMKDVVLQGKAAWANSCASEKHISWLDLKKPKDVKYILSALENASASDYIPESLMKVENLSGVTLVTPQEAKAGYQDAINFIKTYGNAIIGDGPFMLVAWEPSISPPYAKVVKNPYFHLAPPPQAMVEPAMYSVSFIPPATVYAGETLNGTVMETPEGSTSAVPATGVSVTVVLESPNGKILLMHQLTTNSNGVFTFTLPSTLVPGSYIVQLITYSNSTILINPVTVPLVVVHMVTTTTTSTTPTTTPITTSTTITSNLTTIGITVAVIVIIIVVAAVVLLRRR